MPSSTLRHGSFDAGPAPRGIVGRLLAGPLAWAALLEMNYVLSYVACEQRQTWMLHLAAGVALALVGARRRSPGGRRRALSYEREREPSTDPVETAMSARGSWRSAAWPCAPGSRW